MLRPRLILFGAALALVASAFQEPRSEPAAETAAADAPHGVLRFELRGEDGQPMPGRLTFLGAGGPHAELFPGEAAQPEELAVRKNVIYTKSGSGAVTVPVGAYVIYASRGIEWSLAAIELEIEAGATHTWTPQLVHEVDTAGQVSGDFHLHTLTHSGHGDSNMEERIISLIGEGVEFAVATDHNHHTDYGPTVEQLGVQELIGHTVGNEVSTPLGHFNAFPLDPRREPVDSSLNDGDTLFRLLRASPNAAGIRPVIQLNHPRWGNIDYFGKTELDPVTGRTSNERFSHDFDTIELMNENPGWGYYDAETAEVPTGSSEHSVLQDWFNLLNRGQRYAAVGNSDSHTVHDAFAGYPRNYVPNPAGSPGEIDVVDVAAALRAGQVFTTTGPFVEFAIDGVRMGGEVRVQNTAEVEVHLRIQAASWIDCDRFKLVVNGDVRRTVDVPEKSAALRLDLRLPLVLDRDAWVAVLVEGDDPLLPVTCNTVRPVRPLAVTNPIRVDFDGDGVWTAPYDQAVRALEQARSVQGLGMFGPKTGLALLLLAAPSTRPEFGPELIQRAVDSWDRASLLAAARCAEALAEDSLLPVLEKALPRTEEDPYARLALLRALEACGDPAFAQRLAAWIVLARDRLDAYRSELADLLPGRPAAAWMVIGPFDPAREGVLGPEQDARTERTHVGLGGRVLEWTPARASDSGYLDLRAVLDAAGGPGENVTSFAQTWVFAPARAEYTYALGSDDGCRVWVADQLLLEDPAQQAAEPFKHLGRVALEPGWNRLLMRIENGGGPHGLYFRVLDDGVTTRALPE